MRPTSGQNGVRPTEPIFHANVGLTDPAILASHAANLLQLGVRTSTFGVGDDYNEELLGQLADAGGGACHDIAGAEGIHTALGRELGDALEVVCADTRVRLTWQADLQVRVLGTWGSQPGPRSLTILPGDLVSEQALDLLVEVRFPPGPLEGDCGLQVQVSDGERTLVTGEWHWTWADSAQLKPQPRDSAVEGRVATFLAYQARREAAARNRDGDLDGARERLRQAAAELRRYNGQDAEVQALATSLEIEVENHRARLSQRDIKQRIYQSASVMKGRRLDGGRARIDDAPEFPARPGRLHGLGPQDSLAGGASQGLPKLSREQCAMIAKATLTALMTGTYANAAGQPVDWHDAVEQAIAAKRSLPVDVPLPAPGPRSLGSTPVQVTNESTLVAARRLTARHRRVLVLVFGNGIEPGGGFLLGNRGQESALCRASALYATLEGDPMYASHKARPQPDSTDWAILSPDVPVFRDDAGRPQDQPWPLSFITSAAPYAPRLGQAPSARLMESRIRRVLAIARAYGYQALVLGAWGCGTYGNDPARIAAIFRAALEEQAGAFAEVVFAVVDGSPERRFFSPFAAVFGGQP